MPRISSLEDPGCGNDSACQLASATFSVDRVIDQQCQIDGVSVQSVASLSSFRFANPQISFAAPTPWIFGATGGTATSTGDGYYIFLNPLSPGQHTIRMGGAFLFTQHADGFRFYLHFDMTYNITVQ